MTGSDDLPSPDRLRSEAHDLLLVTIAAFDALWSGEHAIDVMSLVDRSHPRLSALGVDVGSGDAAALSMLGLAEVYVLFRSRWDRELFVSWFIGQEHELDGRRPVDVFCAHGAEPLLAALVRADDQCADGSRSATEGDRSSP